MGKENLLCMSADGMMTQNSSFPGNDGRYTCNLIAHVEYAKYGDISLEIQIIKPESETKKFPLIVYLQGSAWLQQKIYRNVPNLCQIARHGYVIAVVQYRHSGQAKYPAQVEDTKAAIRYLRLHADEYGIDKEKVGIFGDSSGAHIAMMTAFTKGKYNNGLYAEESDEVSAIANFYGLSDFLSNRDYSQLTHEQAMELPESMVLGCVPGENPELAKEASPLTYITEDADIQPMLVVHGDSDTLVNFGQSYQLVKAMQEAHKKVYFYKVVGGEHDEGIWGKERMNLVADFFTSIYKNKVE